MASLAVRILGVSWNHTCTKGACLWVHFILFWDIRKYNLYHTDVKIIASDTLPCATWDDRGVAAENREWICVRGIERGSCEFWSLSMIIAFIRILVFSTNNFVSFLVNSEVVCCRNQCHSRNLWVSKFLRLFTRKADLKRCTSAFGDEWDITAGSGRGN